MADISMCQNVKCKDRDSCYRFTATPNPYWQSYILLPSKNKNECEFYWDNKKPYANKRNKKGGKHG